MTTVQYVLIISLSAAVGLAVLVFCLWVLISRILSARRDGRKENFRRPDRLQTNLCTAVAAVLAAVVLPLACILCYAYADRLAQSLAQAECGIVRALDAQETAACGAEP